MDAWAFEKGVQLAFIRPGKPVENAYVESFNGKFRDECLNEHWFVTMAQARQETFRAFLQKLADLDSAKGRFEALVWTEFPQGIRVLLDNPYLFQLFWDFQNQRVTESEWKERFAAAKRAAQVALGKRDTVTVLSVVMARIYTLRNQIIHGGATWKSQVNRDQLRDCVKLMGKLVPLIVEIMMDHPETIWGDGCYPVIRT